jgi:hypothetical protein
MLPSTAEIVNLCEPTNLVKHGLRPDELMSRDYRRTQAQAEKIYKAGVAGFQVWSALAGDWHTTVCFLDRLTINSEIQFGTPEVLTLDTPALKEAATLLGFSMGK